MTLDPTHATSLSVSPIGDKLGGLHFDTMEVIDAESQTALNTTSRMHLKVAEVLGTVHTRGRGLLLG
jgi:hypothetical protein